MLEAFKKKVIGMIPGTNLNLAQQKRQMERDLRKQGYSRTHATAIAANRLNKS